MTHALLKHLVHFNRKIISIPEGFRYNRELGYWADENALTSPLVKQRDLLALIRGSKKEDVETGEDLKGK